MTTARSEPARNGRLVRFDAVERTVHWLNASLFLALLATGLTLRGFPGTQWVHRRHLVKELHVWIGYTLPIPVVAGLLVPFGRQLRADVHRLARWSRDDKRWWSRRERAGVALGKFNPGQKLNSAFVGASLIVMPITGLVMRFPDPFNNSWRAGATTVHDYFAYGLLFTIVGHILFAFADRDALRAMVRGWVPASWARLHAPRWHAELTASDRRAESRSEPVGSRR